MNLSSSRRGPAEYTAHRMAMQLRNARSSADPDVGRPSSCADDRMQNIQFGMARADCLGDQVAEHIGGSVRAFATLPAVTLCDRRGGRHYGLGLPGPGRGNRLGIGAVGVLLVRDTQEVAQQAPDDQRRLRLRSGLIDRGARGIVGAFSAASSSLTTSAGSSARKLRARASSICWSGIVHPLRHKAQAKRWRRNVTGPATDERPQNQTPVYVSELHGRSRAGPPVVAEQAGPSLGGYQPPLPGR